MFKSRCLWLLLATFLVAFLSLAAIYRFLWYPNTLRGRFHRVQMGMTEAEVMRILGPPREVEMF